MPIVNNRSLNSGFCRGIKSQNYDHSKTQPSILN
jgi:hypothetical protein